MHATVAALTILATVHGVSAGGASTCARAWGSSKHCEMAVSICLAESGGNNHAKNVNSDSHRSVDRGLWQINNYWHREVTDSCAYDASCNAKAARKISSGGTNWSPWSTFHNGAYRQHSSEAKHACNHATFDDVVPASLPHNIDADVDYQEIIDEMMAPSKKIRGGYHQKQKFAINKKNLLEDVAFSKDVVRSGGLGICGDPCLSSSDCASNLFCHEEGTMCVDKDTQMMLGQHCNAAAKSTDDVAFNKCSCNLVHKAECAGAVAGCAVACIGSFGVACVACIDLIPGCCDCASALFGFDCSHC